MAEIATLNAGSPLKDLAVPPGKGQPRVRFQRAKPNLSGVGGRRQALPHVAAATSASAVRQALSTNTLAATNPTTSKLCSTTFSAIPDKSPVSVNDEIQTSINLPVDSHDIGVRNPPPVRRLTSNLISHDRECTSTPHPVLNVQATDVDNAVNDLTPADSCISDTPVSLEQSSEAIAETSRSNDKQISSDATVFLRPSTTVSMKLKEQKRSSQVKESNKDVPLKVIKNRPKKIIIDKPEKNKMTMFDFIHWNPTSNPMIYEEDENRIPIAEKQIDVDDTSDSASQKLNEENIDNPDGNDQNVTGDVGNEGEQQVNATMRAAAAPLEEEDDDAMPVPQVKIGPDGNIIVDEQSLVIESTASKTSQLKNSPPVYEHSSNTNYNSYRKKKPCKNWREKETAKFFMALSSVGTDFSLMENFFPKRSRHELKLKFKREERLNRHLIEKAINDRQQFDPSLISDDDDDEENELDKSIRKAKAKCRRQRGRKKKIIDCSKENECVDSDNVPRKRKYKRRCNVQIESDSDGVDESTIAIELDDEPPKRKKKTIRKRKKCLPIDADDDYHKDVMSTINDVIGASTEQIPVSDQVVNQIEFNSVSNVSDHDNEDDDDDESEECIDNLLQKTRSGRQPKKNSVFTIGVGQTTTRKKRRKQQPIATPMRRLSQSPSDPATPMNTRTVESTPLILTPNQLILLAEKPMSGGSQVIHLLMYSPSMQTTGVTPYRVNVTDGSLPCSVPDSAVTSISLDNVELQSAITQISNENDAVVTC